ncbi:hypothetical protein [Chamaesiphon sp. VAR_69_metabat_338]|uniref:hypothetical protein n=1 Tax=Chamaesiphon sp. VAR_69_metabat_338 TaxID=2964704 RepID=UPI00286D93BA|nr:hypothetical protein [Chamaesiphon sp. VAR_69_metabat_338]
MDKTTNFRGLMLNSTSSEHVTLVEELELIGSFAEYKTVIESAVQRLATEGIKELITLQFYTNPRHTKVSVIITFSDRDKVMEHIKMISGWADFKQMFALVKPIDIKVYGKLSVGVEAWLQQFNVVSQTFDERIAGFVR